MDSRSPWVTQRQQNTKPGGKRTHAASHETVGDGGETTVDEEGEHRANRWGYWRNGHLPGQN